MNDKKKALMDAMNNPEQMNQINKMLNKANFELNRVENRSCNIARVSESEVWKNLGEIQGFEEFDMYEVSTFGRVKSLNYRDTGKERIKKLCKDNKGYLVVGMTANGKSKQFKVHRLTALCHVYNPDPTTKTHVNHVNHQKNSNFYKNLSWVTPLENSNAFADYDDEKVVDMKRKMSKNHVDVSGENNPMFNKQHTEETRRKMSIAAKGKLDSDETCEKKSIAAKTRWARQKANIAS